MNLARSILHLSAATVYGGGEEHIRTLLGALEATKRSGESVALACPEGAPLAQRVRELGVTVHEVSFGGKTDPLAPLRLRALVKSEEFTHVHSHNRREDLASILGTPGGVTRLTTLHDRVNMTQEGTRSTTIPDRVYLRILPRFDRILAVSQATLDDYTELTGDRRATNAAITNGMDLSRLDAVVATPLRQTYSIAESALLIVLSARVREAHFGKKGHLRLLEALAKMTCPVHLVTVGEDHVSGSTLKAHAEGAGVAVTCLGFQEDALPVLAAADVVVLPSLFEGLPRSLMEGMALGKAVVGSDVDGIRVLTDNGNAGRLLPPEEADAWAQALDELAQNPDMREALGEAAARRVRSAYSGEAMAADHWVVYRD